MYWKLGLVWNSDSFWVKLLPWKFTLKLAIKTLNAKSTVRPNRTKIINYLHRFPCIMGSTGFYYSMKIKRAASELFYRLLIRESTCKFITHPYVQVLGPWVHLGHFSFGPQRQTNANLKETIRRVKRKNSCRIFRALSWEEPWIEKIDLTL